MPITRTNPVDFSDSHQYDIEISSQFNELESNTKSESDQVAKIAKIFKAHQLRQLGLEFILGRTLNELTGKPPDGNR
jgi:hypothetical protein